MRIYVKYCICLIALVVCNAGIPEQTKEKQHNAATKQNETDDLVIVVQNDAEASAESHKTAKDSEENDRKIANETTNLAVYTYRLFWATFIIAVIAGFQLVMFYRQWQVMRSTLISSNRPRIVLRAMTMVVGDHPELGANHAIVSISFMIANVGGSRAKLVHSAINANIVGRQNHKLPIYSGGNIECKAKYFNPGDTEQVVCDLDVPQPIVRIISLAQNEDFVVHGYIVYLDDMGARRQSYFYRIWDEGKQRFDKSQDKDLEYEY